MWPEGTPDLIREGPAWVIQDKGELYGVVWFDTVDFPPQGHVVLWRGVVGSAGILNAIFDEFGSRTRIYLPKHTKGERGAAHLIRHCGFVETGEVEYAGQDWIKVERWAE